MNKNYILYYLMYEEEPYLYAYTDNKDFAKRFEKERNMELFAKDKSYFSKKEINYITKSYPHQYLREYNLNMYDKDTGEWSQNNIIMTIDECLTMNMAVIKSSMDLHVSCWTDPYIFNDDVIKALNTLGYNKIYKDITKEYKEYEDDKKTTLKVDELGIFLKYFGYTMKGM